MPLIVLQYNEASGVAGSVLTAAVWNRVPLNFIARDDNDNCVLNLDKTFTISNFVYPKILKIKTKVTAVNTAVPAMLLKSRLDRIKGSVVTLLDTSLNAKIITQEGQALVEQLLTVELTNSYTFSFELYVDRAGVFGRPTPDGLPERYASVEILIE